jgi:hypothetical protein
MPSCTRRRVIGSALALSALLAGCNDRPERPPPATTARSPQKHVARDPDSITLRGPATEPIVTVEPAEQTTDESDPRSWRGRGLIASREVADRLTIADVADAEAARQFVAETEFATETLGYEAWRVEECRRRELCHVVWDDEEYELWFMETYRDADVACSVDAHNVTATLFRVPGVLDPDLESGGIGVSRHGCRDPERSQERS